MKAPAGVTCEFYIARSLKKRRKWAIGPFFVWEMGVGRHVPENLHRSIEASVQSLGYELVGIEYHPQGRRSLLRVYIDTPDGVSVDDCERASRQISSVLDVNDPIRGQYVLEVSSPGLDRPLFTAEHYRRFLGSRVKLRVSPPIDGRRNFTGVLARMRDDVVVVVQDDEEIEIPFQQIERARLIPEFLREELDSKATSKAED